MASGGLRAVGALLAVALGLTLSQGASAQPAPPPAAPATMGQGAPSTAPVEVPTELMRVAADGITAERVGQRAAATSYSAKANQEALRGAAARVDEAWAQFLPRLTGTARYTRYSDFRPPSFGSGSLVGTLRTPSSTGGPAGTPPGAVTCTGALGPDDFCQAANLSFPLILNNYLLQANITVPISDYFVRLNQNYTAATRSQDAARFDVASERARAAADGRATFYSWLRARGAVVVALQALNDQRSHLALARSQFDVGQASKADVLRAETNVANAELQVEHTRNLADLAEKQVRVAIHAKDEEPLAPGESLEGALPPIQGSLRQLTDEALAARLEIKSIDANAASAREQAKVARAQGYPTLSAFADGIYANPNPRRIPAADEWFPTWDVGAQLVWSPNDTLIARGSAADLESRAAQLEAQRGTLRDNITLEVTQAYQNVREADVALDSAQRELLSALEAYRVAKELFNNGRATSVLLTDAEGDLTRARLDVLNAQADGRTARVRLDHALGRDVRMAGTP